MNYTYILKCADGSLYTGWTNNLQKRLISHNNGTGSKYTSSRRPVELVYFEEHETKHDAMSREVQIKRLTRKQKEALIQGCDITEISLLSENNYAILDEHVNERK